MFGESEVDDCDLEEEWKKKEKSFHVTDRIILSINIKYIYQIEDVEIEVLNVECSFEFEILNFIYDLSLYWPDQNLSNLDNM